MFSQFFGNYLLNQKLVTPEQLADGIQDVQKIHKKIGELAARYGYLTEEQVEQIHIMQTTKDKRFGELVIECGYMNEAELEKLLALQHSDYELLCKVLIDKKILTKADCAHALNDFKSNYKLNDLDSLTLLQTTKINILINDFYDLTQLDNAPVFMKYLTLLFNNITRFIGSDFTPYKEFIMTEPPTLKYFSQNITGAFSACSAVYATEETFIGMASRYAQEEFTEFDEYVQASICDFLNLNNGLFTVNASNQLQMELMLEPPLEDTCELNFSNTVYCVPISFPFGTANFIIADI